MATKIKPLKNIIENAATKSGSFVDPITNAPIKAAIWAAFGAVGPLTPYLHPPNIPPIIPPAVAPQTPAIGPNLDISPKARAKGNAIIATVIPDRTSALILVWRLFIFPQGLSSLKISIMTNPIYTNIIKHYMKK